MPNDNLTESQRRLLAAVRQEVGSLLGENTDKIMAEIARLRKEQTARHEEGLEREKAFMERFRRDIRRHAYGLLGLLGDEDPHKKSK